MTGGERYHPIGPKSGVVRPSVVSLDVGNTLVTSDRPGIATLMRRAVSGHPSLVSRIDDLQRRPYDQADIDNLCDDLCIGRIDLAEYVPPKSQLISGAVDAIVQFKGLGLRVVTLSNVSSVDATPLPSAVRHLIDATYQSFSIGAAKPNVEAFAHMFEKEGVEPAMVVHIGDSVRCDGYGSTAAGATGIVVQRSVPRGQRPFLVVPSLADSVRAVARRVNV